MKFVLDQNYAQRFIARAFLLIKQGGLENDRDVALSFHNVKEIMERLLQRHYELTKLEVIINNLGEKKLGKNSLTEESRNLQQDFVNKVESFHQHVYATTSFFVSLLLKIAPRKHRSQIPRWSVTKFLNYLKELEPKFSRDIDLLIKSEIIRNKCIEHPQQQRQPFTWQTGTFINRTYVIYFIPDETGEQHDISSDVGLDFKLLTSFKAKEYYITPHHAYVFTALCRLFENTLDRLKT